MDGDAERSVDSSKVELVELAAVAHKTALTQQGWVQEGLRKIVRKAKAHPEGWVVVLTKRVNFYPFGGCTQFVTPDGVGGFLEATVYRSLSVALAAMEAHNSGEVVAVDIATAMTCNALILQATTEAHSLIRTLSTLGEELAAEA